MHKAIIKTNKGNKEIYFTYSRHSDILNVTAFCTGEGGQEVTYIKDANILKIIRDPSVRTIMED